MLSLADIGRHWQAVAHSLEPRVDAAAEPIRASDQRPGGRALGKAAFKNYLMPVLKRALGSNEEDTTMLGFESDTKRSIYCPVLLSIALRC